MARGLEQSRIQTAGTILFVGTVGEEGLGNLRGVRNLFHQMGDGIDAFITVDASGSRQPEFVAFVERVRDEVLREAGAVSVKLLTTIT